MPALTPAPNASYGGTGGYGSVPSRHGLVSVLSNADIDRLDREKRDAMERQQRPMITRLATHIKRSYERARRAKDHIEEEMLQAHRQRNAEYDSEKLQAIREMGGSEEFMPLTAVKCRAAEAWILDVLQPTGDKSWGCEPTPIPDLPEDKIQEVKHQTLRAFMEGMIPTPADAYHYAHELREQMYIETQEIAKLASERMDRQIYDQMIEGNWEDTFREFVNDIVTFPTAFIKGPVLRRKPALRHKSVNGRTVPEKYMKLKLEFERVSPFDIYPSPESSDLHDGYLIERMRLTRSYLTSCKGVAGFDSQAIDLVLNQYAMHGYREWVDTDQERAENEDRPLEFSLGTNELIETLDFWGSVQGQMLMEWGFDEALEPFEEYEVNAWLVGSTVIRAVLNPDPLGRRPYSKCSYEMVPGSFWGRSVPQRMREIQNICNATVRNLVNNMGYAAGPQIVINDINRLPAGEDVTSMFPGKVWQFENRRMTTERPIDSFKVDSQSAELMAVYQRFEEMADDHTGIPSYAHGNPEVGGAGGTASGLSMLLNSATKGIKLVIGDIDKFIFKPMITRMYEWNMRYNPDESIKGDINIKPRGALNLILREQMQMRRQEFLDRTLNDIDMKIIGERGRANILRKVVDDLHIPADDVIPDDEELLRRMNAEQQAMMLQEQAIAEQQQQEALMAQANQAPPSNQKTAA